MVKRNPQSRAAPKGTGRRCSKIFQFPVGSLKSEAAIDLQRLQRRSYRPLRREPLGIAKCSGVRPRSRELVFVGLYDFAYPALQKELRQPERVGKQTPSQPVETTRLLDSRPLREHCRTVAR